MNIQPQPSSFNNIPGFLEHLPDAMWCSNHLDFGVILRRKENAVKKPYIQFNDPWTLGWMVFDIDAPTARFHYDDALLPAPNLYIENPKNHHAHYAYLMENPIYCHSNARKGPLSYFKDIRHAYKNKLKADRRFTNFVSKNPLHPQWKTTVLRSLDRPYTLAELDDWLKPGDKHKVPRQQVDENPGEGRNCETFDTVRKQSYTMVRTYKHDRRSEDDFRQWVLNRCMECSREFSEPLSMKELNWIAKSISSWCWIHFSSKVPGSEEFSQLQSQRACKRWEGHVSVESTKPWIGMGISRKTYYKRKAKGQLPAPRTPQGLQVGDQPDRHCHPSPIRIWDQATGMWTHNQSSEI